MRVTGVRVTGVVGRVACLGLVVFTGPGPLFFCREETGLGAADVEGGVGSVGTAGVGVGKVLRLDTFRVALTGFFLLTEGLFTPSSSVDSLSTLSGVITALCGVLEHIVVGARGRGSSTSYSWSTSLHTKPLSCLLNGEKRLQMSLRRSAGVTRACGVGIWVAGGFVLVGGASTCVVVVSGTADSVTFGNAWFLSSSSLLKSLSEPSFSLCTLSMVSISLASLSLTRRMLCISSIHNPLCAMLIS